MKRNAIIIYFFFILLGRKEHNQLLCARVCVCVISATEWGQEGGENRIDPPSTTTTHNNIYKYRRRAGFRENVKTATL